MTLVLRFFLCVLALLHQFVEEFSNSALFLFCLLLNLGLCRGALGLVCLQVGLER